MNASAATDIQPAAPRIGLIGAGIPPELVVAAGCVPILLIARPSDAGRESSPMEASHEAEVRSLFIQALEGAFSDCALLVIASTSDGHRFLYQYLKEMVRTGRGDRNPPLYLYDFLLGDSAPVRRYDRQVIGRFRERLATIGGVFPSAEGLSPVLHQADAARAAYSALRAARFEGRIAGSEARSAIAKAVRAFPSACPEIDDLVARSVNGPAAARRVLLLSSVPVGEDNALYRLVEQAGATIVDEQDCWTGLLDAPAMDAHTDPVTAILEHYRAHTVSPRQLTADRERWLAERLGDGIDGLILHLPPEDQYFGWRYPTLTDVAEAAGVPTLLLRADLATPSGIEEAGEAITAFLMPGTAPSA